MRYKSFYSASRLIAGIETMYMIKKGQLRASADFVRIDRLTRQNQTNSLSEHRLRFGFLR